MQAPVVLIRSALPGVVWPGITAPDVATELALQYQLERSQWLAPATLEALQFRQLATLVRHAWETVPFYRWHWHGRYAPSVELTPEGFASLPLVSRGDLQNEFDALASVSPPAAHGAITEVGPSGAAGGPARMRRTELTGLWARVVTLRDHLWHRRDFDGVLAVVQAGAQAREAEGWGPATAMVEGSGRSIILDASAGMEALCEQLQRIDPDYLLASPSVATAIARISLGRGMRLARLREVWSAGETVSAEMRRSCREAWGVPLTHLYASGEAGCIALQCPDHEHYHVQSESVLVEILDGHGRRCAPGAAGRVVVTTLQNFAMPLIRYQPGDTAEFGEPCSCGRGLPVLRRVEGATAAAPGAPAPQRAH